MHDVNYFNEEEQLLHSAKIAANYTKADLTTENPPEGPPNHHYVSSLDFERIVNEYSIQAVREQWWPLHRQQPHTKPRAPRRGLLGYTGRTATRWVLSALAGLLTGLTSTFIVQITDRIISWRSENVQHLILNPDYSVASAFGVFCLLNMAAALSSSWLCVAWAPQAEGSGISQVKAYLNGTRLNLTCLPLLFVVKVVGTILSVSSGLAIGVEGPLIYIGAIMGISCTKVSAFTSSQLARFQSGGSLSHRRESESTVPSRTQQWLAWTTSELSHFATDGERRDMVSIGASCGFAASFGAPIGGLLFILDDVSSYFNRSLLLRMLVANTIGTFCLAIQHGDLSDYSVISLGTYNTANDDIFFSRFKEVPLYIFIGVVGGLLGGFFCASFTWLRRNITGKFPLQGHVRSRWHLVEVALLSLLTSLLIFYLPSMSWACRDQVGHAEAVLDNDFIEEMDQIKDFAVDERLQNRFFCPQGQVNELGNVLFGSRIESIKRILTDPTDFKRETLLTVGILFYALMTLTFGTALPSGIFTPSVLIGASLGGFAGISFQEWFGTEVSPSTFALLGVAALLAGIQRSTVSLCVILVEGTGQIKVLMPSIITVVVARYVASSICEKGIFEAVMAWKGMPYLDQKENKRRYDGIQVSEIMSDPPVETVHPYERATDLVDLLEHSTHHGFPVVEPTTKRFLGLVRRDQIAALLECGVFDKGANGGEEVRNARRSTTTRPRSRMPTKPLMQWAYHINDDRFDYMLDDTHSQSFCTREEAPHEEAAPRDSVISSPVLQSTRFCSLPTEFATIGRNDKGLIVVSWLNPVYAGYRVNLGAVMNRGTSCVRKFVLDASNRLDYCVTYSPASRFLLCMSQLSSCQLARPTCYLLPWVFDTLLFWEVSLAGRWWAF